MRGTKAKAIRRYVRERFPFLSVVPLYRRVGTSGVLSDKCQRHLYLSIKRNYKKARRMGHITWTDYNKRQVKVNPLEDV